MNRRFRWPMFILLVLLLAGICLMNQSVSQSVRDGLFVCGNTLIPTLLPACLVATLLTSGPYLSLLPQKLQTIILFMFSLISGYPVGASLLNQSVETRRIKAEQARRLLPCFINPGPGLTIGLVGEGLFHSPTVGWYLLSSQVLASLTLFIICGGFGVKPENPPPLKSVTLTKAVEISFDAVIRICEYVIVAFALSGLLSAFLPHAPAELFTNLVEVTTGLLRCRNIYGSCFLISFGGLCVHAQIHSVTPQLNYHPLKLIGVRILHGILSCAFLRVLFRIWPVHLATASLSSYTPVLSGGPGYLILLCFVIISFLLSLSRKKSGKLAEDLI